MIYIKNYEGLVLIKFRSLMKTIINSLLYFLCFVLFINFFSKKCDRAQLTLKDVRVVWTCVYWIKYLIGRTSLLV